MPEYLFFFTKCRVGNSVKSHFLTAVSMRSGDSVFGRIPDPTFREKKIFGIRLRALSVHEWHRTGVRLRRRQSRGWEDLVDLRKNSMRISGLFLETREAKTTWREQLSPFPPRGELFAPFRDIQGVRTDTVIPSRKAFP